MVRVHQTGQPQSHCLLGDLDGQGTSLIGELNRYLKDLDVQNLDETKAVRYLNSKIEGNELLVMIEHGQTGLDATIRSDGKPRYHQVVEDSQDLECGCVFRLPPNQELGWLVLHVNNGRGTKTLLDTALRREFRADFPGLVLDITPCVPNSVLKHAVEHNLVEKVRLVKHVQPSDLADNGVDQWVDGGTVGKLEISIGVKGQMGRAGRVLTQPLRRFLAERPEQAERQYAFDAMVEFRGMRFDTVKIEVKQGVSTRTFNIEKPDSGHPFSEDMRLGPGKPTPDDIFAGLRQALGTVGA
jgi:hypothetical protein